MCTSDNLHRLSSLTQTLAARLSHKRSIRMDMRCDTAVQDLCIQRLLYVQVDCLRLHTENDTHYNE